MVALVAALASGCSSSREPPATHAPPADAGRPAATAPAIDGPPADAFAWFENSGELPAEGFCFLWVHGLTPDQVLQRLHARSVVTTSWAGRPEPDAHDPLAVVTGAGNGWSLLIEDFGVLCIGDKELTELSAGARVIANFRNVNYDERFALAENGTIRVDFDPYLPAYRTGSAPDSLLPDMAYVGLDRSRDDSTEAALALTARLTGVPLTPRMLNAPAYRAGRIPDP